MKYKLFLMIGIYFVAGSIAFASTQTQPEYEVTCRMKAKEIAAETYRTCVTDNKTAEIERIKADYQERLKALKVDYEKEIQRLGGKIPSKAKKEDGVKTATAKSAKSMPVKKTKERKSQEMEVELHPVAPAVRDESSLDIPDPTPLEQIPAENEI
ncbi:MAG: hypothetical protein BroJett040_11740 [Oligoflexia bacterium]|nr:MAG: hypothetical protein BroJett040_11740 [Oligoflexia bacterium]